MIVDPTAENCCRGSENTHFSSHLHANLFELPNIPDTRSGERAMNRKGLVMAGDLEYLFSFK
jgi:hypothetical protein